MFELFMHFTVSKNYKYVHTKTIWFCTYIIFYKTINMYICVSVYIFIYMYSKHLFTVVQSLSLIWLSATSWTATHQVCPSLSPGVCSVWLLCNPYVNLETTLPDAHWDFSESSNYSCNFGSWFFNPLGKHFMLPFKITIRPLLSGVYFFK